MEENRVIENSVAKILWEVPVRTDKTMKENRPDIVLVMKDVNKTNLIDVTVPQDYKEMAKVELYELLKKEVNRIWETKTEVEPVVIGAM